MLCPSLAADDVLDVSRQWCRMTSEQNARAMAYLRAGGLYAIRVMRRNAPGRRPFTICRAGAVALLSRDAVAAIEAQARAAW